MLVEFFQATEENLFTFSNIIKGITEWVDFPAPKTFWLQRAAGRNGHKDYFPCSREEKDGMSKVVVF